MPVLGRVVLGCTCLPDPKNASYIGFCFFFARTAVFGLRSLPFRVRTLHTPSFNALAICVRGHIYNRWMAAMRRCQRIDEASSGSSPGLGGRFPEGARGAGGGRKTIGLRAEALMDKFRKANPVSEERGRM